MKSKLADVWQRLNFAQAIVIVAALVGVVCMILFAPAVFWQHVDQVDWKFWLGVTLAATGVSSPFLDRLLGARRDTTRRMRTIRGDVPAYTRDPDTDPTPTAAPSPPLPKDKPS